MDGQAKWWKASRPDPATSSPGTHRGAKGGSTPSPRASAWPRVSLLQTSPTDLHPISMKFHLLPGVAGKHRPGRTGCVATTTQTHTNTLEACAHAQRRVLVCAHTHARRFHYPSQLLSDKISDSLVQPPANYSLM